MAGRPTKLTLEVHKTIVAYIRGGVFGHVAAAAAGTSARTFYRWMERGERRPGIYRDFMEDVQQARALARAKQEVKVFAENPLAWLRWGPGRDRPGEPGWTDGRTRLDSRPISDAEWDAAAERAAIAAGMPDRAPEVRAQGEEILREVQRGRDELRPP